MSIIEGGIDFFNYLTTQLPDFPQDITEEIFHNLQNHLTDNCLEFELGAGSLISSVLGLYPAEKILEALEGFLSAHGVDRCYTMLTGYDMPDGTPRGGRIPPPEVHFDFFLKFIRHWDRMKNNNFVPMKFGKLESGVTEVFVAIIDTASPPQNENVINGVINNVLTAEGFQNIQVIYCQALQYRVKDFFEGLEFLLGLGYKDNLQGNPTRYNIQSIRETYYQDLWKAKDPNESEHRVLSDRGIILYEEFGGNLCNLVLQGGGTRIIVGILRSLETILSCSDNPDDPYLKVICNIVPFLIHSFLKIYVPLPGIYYFGWKFSGVPRKSYAKKEIRDTILHEIAEFDGAVNSDYVNALDSSLFNLAPEACLILPGYSSMIISRIYRYCRNLNWHLINISRQPVGFPVRFCGPFQWRSRAHLEAMNILKIARVITMKQLKQALNDYTMSQVAQNRNPLFRIEVLAGGIKLLAYFNPLLYKNANDTVLIDNLVFEARKRVRPIHGLLGKAKILKHLPFIHRVRFMHNLKGQVNYLESSDMKDIPPSLKNILKLRKRRDIGFIYLE